MNSFIYVGINFETLRAPFSTREITIFSKIWAPVFTLWTVFGSFPHFKYSAFKNVCMTTSHSHAWHGCRRYGLSFLFTFKNIENFLYYWFIVRCAIFFRFIPRRFDDFRVLTTIFVSGYFNYGVLVRAVHHSSMLRETSSRKPTEKLSNSWLVKYLVATKQWVTRVQIE